MTQYNSELGQWQDDGEWRTNLRTFEEVDLRGLVTYWSWQIRESYLRVLWVVDDLCAREDKRRAE